RWLDERAVAAQPDRSASSDGHVRTGTGIRGSGPAQPVEEIRPGRDVLRIRVGIEAGDGHRHAVDHEERQVHEPCESKEPETRPGLAGKADVVHAPLGERLAPVTPEVAEA